MDLPFSFELFSEFHPSLYEAKLREKGCQFIAGTDEVGRGCLAGPVVAAAVILPSSHSIRGIKDSKLLKPADRERISKEIQAEAISWSVGLVEAFEIDQINIFHASLKAMQIAVKSLSLSPDFLLVDGKFPMPNFSPQQPVIQGDSHCESISAASIIAKVTRDRLMQELEKKYSSYSFSIHKGYPTEKHREEIRKHGPSEIHRRSFRLL